MARRRRSPSRLETLGAWLRIWTPPRDVEVPPVPWRLVALGGVALAAAIGALAALALPALERSRDRAERAERRAEGERRASERRRILAEQRPRRGRAAGVALPPLSPRRELAARRSVLAALEAAVRADARHRARSGALRHPVGRVECEPHPRGTVPSHPERDLRRRIARYSCLAVTSDIPRGAATRTGGAIGYPFLAVVDFSRRAWAFCKVNPVPGEQVVPDPRTVIRLPTACTRPPSG